MSNAWETHTESEAHHRYPFYQHRRTQYVCAMHYPPTEEYGADEAVPYMPLCGCWLGEYGFEVGAKVDIRAAVGSILLTLRDPQGPNVVPRAPPCCSDGPTQHSPLGGKQDNEKLLSIRLLLDEPLWSRFKEAAERNRCNATHLMRMFVAAYLDVEAMPDTTPNRSVQVTVREAAGVVVAVAAALPPE